MPKNTNAHFFRSEEVIKSTTPFQGNMGSHSQSVNELLDVETEYPISELSDLRRKSERSENLKIRKSNIESKDLIIPINEHHCFSTVFYKLSLTQCFSTFFGSRHPSGLKKNGDTPYLLKMTILRHLK
jgi:hypothetical protein